MGGARTWGKYTPSTWPDGTPAEWTPGDPCNPQPRYPIDNETGEEVKGKEGKTLGRGATCFLNSEVRDFVNADTALRMAKKEGRKYASYCQEIMGHEEINLFFDIDDKADDQASAEAREKEIIDWVQATIHTKLPQISPDEIAISTNTRIHPSTNVVLKSGMPFEEEKWNKWKVSVHVCINGVKCRLNDQALYFDEEHWFDNFPRSAGCDGYDSSLYKGPRQIIRLINNGKPQQSKQEYIMVPDGKGGENKESLRRYTCKECQAKGDKMPFKCSSKDPKDRCRHEYFIV
eukprot:SAG11_NODE_9754_length_882_cov_499.210728_1_plen_288_part_01